MAINNQSYEDQTRKLQAETQSELMTIENQLAELQSKRDMIKKEAEAYEIVLNGFLKREGKQNGVEIDWNKLLNGQTHKEKLKIIAKQNGGIIEISKTADFLYSKGFIKSKGRINVYKIIQHLLADLTEEGFFEKTAPGVYKLISIQ